MSLGNEDIEKVCEYIRLHKPQATDFDTIEVAIKAVTGDSDCKVATQGEMIGDDAWLLSEKEANKFAGIRLGPGSWQGFSPSQVKMIMDAVETAKSVENYGDDYNDLEDIDIAMPIAVDDEFKYIVDNNKLNEIDLPKVENINDSFIPSGDLNKIDFPPVEPINNSELKSMIDEPYSNKVDMDFTDLHEGYDNPDNDTYNK